MTDERFFTPPQIAKILGVGVDKVAAFIERRELIAVNTSLSERPRWKVEPAALRRFLESRSNAPRRGAERTADLQQRELSHG